MTLIIRQLVIRGEVIEDSDRLGREGGIDYEQVRQLIEAARREIEKDYQEKISEMIENSSAR
jgi:hypothetical protein